MFHRFTGRRVDALLMLVAIAIALVTVVGCGKSTTYVRGRVITGSVGQAVVAAPGDERFDELGIPGLTVSVLAKGGSVARGRGVFAEAVSDEFGDFELPFPGGSFPRDVVEIHVSGDGVYTARSTTFMPTEGNQLLCVVITRPGYVPPEPNRDPKE